MIRARSSATLCLLVAACSSASHTPTAASGGASNSGALLDAPTGTVTCASDTGIDTYAPGLKKSGQNGLFDFELVSSSPAPPAVNDNTFLVRVTGADGTPLAGQLAATLYMPDHGHYSPDTPVVTFDATSGTYTLEPMNLFMVGFWRITFTFQPGADAGVGAAGASDEVAASDSAVFKFCVD